MRGIRGFLPNSTASIIGSARFVGRPLGKKMVNSPTTRPKPSTASGMVQRAVGKSFTPQKVRKEIYRLSQHASRADTPEGRAFLRAFQQRQKISTGKLKQMVKGMYRTLEETDIKTKFSPGTLTEKTLRFAKEEEARNAPPPAPRRDPGEEHRMIARALEARVHGGLSSRGQPTQTAELPTSSASGWTKPEGLGSGLPTGGGSVARTGRGSTTPTKEVLVFGHKVRIPDKDTEDEDTKIKTRELEMPPPPTPALGQGSFTGGRISDPEEKPDRSPYDVSVAPSSNVPAAESAPAAPPPPAPTAEPTVSAADVTELKI